MISALDGMGSHSQRPARSRLNPLMAHLTQLDRRSLQDAWLAAFGRRPPIRLSRELLVLALSYHAQAGRTGGLSEAEQDALGISAGDWIAGDQPPTVRAAKGRTGNALREAHAHFVMTGDAGQRTVSPARPSPRPVRRSIKPGTRLLRDWQGETHEVIAESTGQFLYRGKTYRSLSAIARTITGTRWSGPTFFGIATNNQAKKAGGGDNA